MLLITLFLTAALLAVPVVLPRVRPRKVALVPGLRRWLH